MRIKRFSGILVFLCLAFLATAQIRDFVPVVRPVYHAETVAFLEKLSASMKADGYDEAASLIKSYAEGGFGSGFVILAPDGSPYIVTNRHVVSQAASITVEFQKADESTVTYKNCQIVAVDEDLDLALVALPKGAGPFKSGLAFAAERSEDGAEVWSAGYPGLGSEPSWQLGKGNVTNAIAKIPELADPAVTTLIQHSAQIDPGNSGGPLLVTDKSAPAGYRVIGINTWKAYDRQATNFAIPAAAIKRFIDSSLARATGTAAQSPILEGRCKDFIGAAVGKDDAYRTIYRYVSYGYVAKDGEAVLKDVLQVAPTAVRDTILTVFTSYSPIEGIRLAIAYRIQTGLKGKDGPLSLSFVSVDGNPDTPDTEVPVRFTRDGKEIVVTWTREQGLWRIASYPLELASARSKDGKASGDEGTSSATTGELPYSTIVLLGAELPLSSTGATIWGCEFGFSIGAYGAISGSSYFGMRKTTDYYGYMDSSMILRAGAGLQLRYPVILDAANLIPYIGISGGLAIDSDSMGDSSSSILYTQAEAGLQVGFSSGLYLSAAYRVYIDIPSGFPASSVGLLFGFGL
jgi:serine protease Do